MTREEGMRTPTHLPSLRALPEDVRVQGEASGQGSGPQRQAGPQRVQRRLPPAVQKLRGRGEVGEVSGARGGARRRRAEEAGRATRAEGKGVEDGAPPREDGGRTARKGRGLRGGGAAKGRHRVGALGREGWWEGAGKRGWRRVGGAMGGKPDVAESTCGSSWLRGGRGPQSRHSSKPGSSVRVRRRCGT